MVFREKSSFKLDLRKPSFGEQTEELSLGQGSQDPQDAPTKCHQARSQIQIVVSMSGGPQHQIRYCWDASIDEGRGDGEYDPDGWNNGRYQYRWTSPDDQYEGKFSVERELLTDPDANTGACGQPPQIKCPEWNCCCPEDENGNTCGDGAGWTSIYLRWEVFDYVTPAPVVTGKKPAGRGPELNSIQQGEAQLNLCKADHVQRLNEIRSRLAPLAETKEIHLNAVLTSRNTRQKCFIITDPKVYKEELERWLGGKVNGNDVWTDIKEVCALTGPITWVAGIFDIPELLCSRLTGGGECLEGPMGYFKLGRKLPTGCIRPEEGGFFSDGNGPSNYYAVRLYGANRSTNRVLHPKSFRYFWEHGESDNPDFTPEGRQGSRENILAIIAASVNDPVNTLCEYHQKKPLEILEGMGKYGKKLLCNAIDIKSYEMSPFQPNKQPVNIGMAWCLSAVRKLLGG